MTAPTLAEGLDDVVELGVEEAEPAAAAEPDDADVGWAPDPAAP